MAPKLAVTPQNVRGGADKVDGVKTQIGEIAVPAHESAASGLPGFATAAALTGVAEAVKSSLTVRADRYEELGQLLRRAVDNYEHIDQGNPAAPGSLTSMVGTSMAAMGEPGAAR